MARRRVRRRSPSQSCTHARASSTSDSTSATVVGSKLLRRIRTTVRQHPLAIVLALVLLHVTLALMTFLPQPHTGGDSAAYVTLGRSLLEHRTYTELWDPATPPHTKYPPVFPSILAAAMATGLQPWAQLKYVVIALSAVAVAFTFLWVRARRRAALALGVGIVIAIAPGVLREGRWLLSDVPFWAFTMIALWAFERLRADDWKRFAIAAAATLLAYFTRTAGLPLVIAALAWLAWRRHWKQFGALALIIGVPALLWLLRARAFGPSGYVSEFWLADPYAPAAGRIGIGDIFGRIVENASSYASVHLPILLGGEAVRAPGPIAGIAGALAFIIAVLALGGWIVRLRSPRVADLFLPLYVGLIFVWPVVWSGERFLLPLLGLILFYAGEALIRITRRLAPRMMFITGAAAVLLLLLVARPGLARDVRIGRECTARYRAGEPFPCLGNPAWDEYFDIALMTQQALPDGAVVLSRKPRLFHAIGGTRGRIYPFSPEPADFFAAAADAGARYLIFDGLSATSANYLRPVLLRKPGAFCIMHITPVSQTILFGIHATPASVPDLGQAGLTGSISPSFTYCDEGYWRGEDAQRTFGVR